MYNKKIKLIILLVVVSFLTISLIPNFNRHVIAADTTTFFSSNDDGYISSDYESDWSDARDATDGSRAFPDASTSSVSMGIVHSTKVGGYSIYRAFFEFDTSSIPSDATITSAYLNIYGFSNNDADVIVIKSTQGDSLTTSDFDEIDFSTPYSSEFTGWSTGGYNNITLNSDFYGDVSTSGNTYLAIVEYDHDYSDSAPVNSEKYFSGCYFSEETGTGKDPYLVITYDTGGGGCGDTLVQHKPDSSEADDWSNLGNAYDTGVGYLETAASTITADSWAYFNYSSPISCADEVHFYASRSGSGSPPVNMDIDVYNEDTSSWMSVIADTDYAEETWHNLSFAGMINNITASSIRVSSDDAGAFTTVFLHDISLWCWEDVEEGININPSSNETPANNGVNLFEDAELSVYVEHDSGTNMDCWINTSTDGVSYSAGKSYENIWNETISYTYENLDWNRTYYWKVEVSDGSDTDSRIYSFQQNGYFPYCALYFNATDSARQKGAHAGTLTTALPWDEIVQFDTDTLGNIYCGMGTLAMLNLTEAENTSLNDSATFKINTIYYHHWQNWDVGGGGTSGGSSVKYGYNVSFPSSEVIDYLEYTTIDFLTNTITNMSSPISGDRALLNAGLWDVDESMATWDNVTDIFNANGEINNSFGIVYKEGAPHTICNYTISSWMILNPPSDIIVCAINNIRRRIQNHP
jgi:hypothetical protein